MATETPVAGPFSSTRIITALGVYVNSMYTMSRIVLSLQGHLRVHPVKSELPIQVHPLMSVGTAVRIGGDNNQFEGKSSTCKKSETKGRYIYTKHIQVVYESHVGMGFCSRRNKTAVIIPPRQHYYR